jgi:hypothetical protein
VKPTSNNLTITGAALDAYIGGGRVLFNIYSTATDYRGVSGGNWNASVDKSFDTAVRATYEYTPVPIPAAFWLLGTGLAGLAGLRRNMKRIG